MAVGFKSGGRQKGTPNKKTVVRRRQIEAAIKSMANADGSGIFAGDGHALLMAVYKNEAMPIEIRADCAKVAVRYEKPALSAVENTGDIQSYIVRMPAKPKDLAEWTAGLPDQDNTDSSSDQFQERIERVRKEAVEKEQAEAVKKGLLQ